MNANTSLRWLTCLAVAVVLTGCITTTNNRPVTKKQDAAMLNVQLGIAYMNQGDLNLAKDKLDKARKQDPDVPAVHSAWAMLYDRLNKPKQADEEFREALRLAPNDPGTINNYAVYLCRTGRTEEGVKLFLDVAQNGLYRTPEAAYTNAGVCLRAAKKYDLAIEQLQRALKVRPNYAEAEYQLVELQFAQGDLPGARSQLDRYLGFFNATPDLLLVGVRITRAQGDRLAAEKLSRKLRVDFPDSDQARRLTELDRNPG